MNEKEYNLGMSLVTSPGWEGWLLPMLENEVAQQDAALGLTVEERVAPKFSDEFLRGYRRGLLFATLRPGRLLREYETEQALKTPAVASPGHGDPYGDDSS